MFDFKKELNWTLYVLPIFGLLILVSLVNLPNIPQNALNILIWIRIISFGGLGISFFVIGYTIFMHFYSETKKLKRFVLLLLTLIIWAVGGLLLYFIYSLHTDKLDLIIGFIFLFIPVIILTYLYARNVSKIEKAIVDSLLNSINQYKEYIIKISELLLIGTLIYYSAKNSFFGLFKHLPQNKYGAMFIALVAIGAVMGFMIVAIVIIFDIVMKALFTIKEFIKNFRRKEK